MAAPRLNYQCRQPSVSRAQQIKLVTFPNVLNLVYSPTLKGRDLDMTTFGDNRRKRPRQRSQTPILRPSEDVSMSDHTIIKSPTQKGHRLTLHSLRNQVTPKHTSRNEDNYHTAVVSIVANEGAVPEDPVNIIERLSVNAIFLQTYDFANMITKENGGFNLQELRPGKSAGYIFISMRTLHQPNGQDNLKSCCWRRSRKATLLSHPTSTPSKTMRGRSWRSAYLFKYEIRRHSILPAETHKNQPKSSNLQRPVLSNSSTRRNLMQRTLWLEEQSQSLTIPTALPNLTPMQNQICAEHVKRLNVFSKTNVAIFDAEAVVSPMKPKPVKVLPAKFLSVLSVVMTDTISQNARWLSTTMNKATSLYIIRPLDCDYDRKRCKQKAIETSNRAKNWSNPRMEEAKDKIYRLPPPGNGESQQKNITDYFQRIQIGPDDHSRTDIRPQQINEHDSQMGNTHLLKIIQWNACSLNEEKRVQLEFLVLKQDIDIICISEVGKYRQIRGYPNYVKSDTYTQSAIFWKDGLNVNKIETKFSKSHSRIMTQCILIANEVLLIHPYIAPELSNQVRASFWSDLLIFINEWAETQPSHKILITGDLNTRDKRFGINHTENHNYLDEVLLHMDIISDIRVPTREANSLDITLGNKRVRETKVSCKVLHKLNSDHNPTSLSIQLDRPTYAIGGKEKQTNEKVVYTVMDKQKTMNILQLAINETDKQNVTLNQINAILQSSVAYKRINQKPIQFWTQELKKAVRLQNKARRAIGRARRRNEETMGPYQEYKQAQKEFRQLFQKAKKQYSIDKIKKACEDPTGAAFFRAIKQIQPKLNKKAQPKITHSVEADEETELIAKQFEDVFGQKDVQPSAIEQRKLDDRMAQIKSNLLSEESPLFTARELAQAMRKANMHSTTGPDGVSNKLIKISLENLQFQNLMLQAINNQIIHKGVYPQNFKQARIIPLPKPKPGEYRPISLLPSMSKIVEYMIQIRMREIVEKLLPHQQFGCRAGHSTAQALMRLMHHSGVAAGTDRQFGAILYDFAKAYDRVPRHVLIDKMIKLNIPNYLVNIVYEWLTERKFTVTFRNRESRVRDQLNGIPQGSSLSVLLWIIFVYDIPLNEKLSNTYVDDTIGWETGLDKREVLGNLRHQLKKMVVWCEKNRIKMNFDKTHVIFNEYHHKDCIKFRNVCIKTTDSIRYLGIELKANKEKNSSTFLIGTEQIAKNIIRRCRAIKMIRRFRVPEKTFRQACIAFIGGVFNYYTPWIGAELAIKCTKRPLELAYHEYMRAYTGCIRSTPIPALYAISKFPLLEDKIITDSSLTVLKAEAQGNLVGTDYRRWDREGCIADGWTPFGKVRKAIEHTAKKYETKIHSQEIVQSNTLEHLSRCQFHLGNRETALEKHKEGKLIPTNIDIAIWTDGSLNREEIVAGEETTSGAAAIIHIADPEPHSSIFQLEIHTSLQLKNVTSSYEAEIIALQSGLDAVLQLHPEGRHIHVFTDSLSCLQQLACLPYKYKFTNVIVKDVAEILAHLADTNEVELHFIPSHTSKIRESDQIDELAKEAAVCGDDIDHDPFVSSYKLVFKKYEKIKLRKYINLNLKNSKFANYPKREPLRDGYLRIRNRNGHTDFHIDSGHALLNRVRTGHTRARTHLKNIGVESDNVCRHCSRHPESIQHQLIECRKFKKRLKKFRRQYTNLQIDDFNQALYIHSKFMANFLTSAQKHGCFI